MGTLGVEMAAVANEDVDVLTPGVVNHKAVGDRTIAADESAV